MLSVTAMRGGKSSNAWIAAALLAVVSGLILLADELVLRWRGYQPWMFASIDSNEPRIAAPDPVLGWKPKPGHYVIPPFTASCATSMIADLDALTS